MKEEIFKKVAMVVNPIVCRTCGGTNAVETELYEGLVNCPDCSAEIVCPWKNEMPTKKVKLTIENLTVEQAKMFAEWYEGQGEQDAANWFNIHDVPTPMTDVSRKGGYRTIDEEGNVTVYIKS